MCIFILIKNKTLCAAANPTVVASTISENDLPAVRGGT